MNQFTASLWGDEAFAAVLAAKPYWQIITTVARDTSPPLFYLSLHTWMYVFGKNEIAIRLHSFFYFFLLCWVVFLIAKFLFDKKTAIIAFFLTFFNPFLFYYGFEGRMYSILAFFSTLSMYFFLTKNWRYYILATAGALYSHHFALLIIFLQLFWVLVDLKNYTPKTLFKAFKPFFITALLYLPWIYPLVYQTMLVEKGFWLGKPTIKTVFDLFKNFLVGSAKHPLQKFAFWTSLGILAIRKWGKKDLFLLSWFLIPVGTTFIVSYLGSSIFFDRYLLPIIPPLIILLASKRRKYLSFGFLGILVLSLAIINYHYFFHPTKRPFKELANYIKQTTTPSDFLINWSGKAHHLFESKYYGIKAPLYYPKGKPPFYIGTALMEEEDIIQALPKVEKIGVITSDPIETIKLPGYHLGETKQFDSLKFLWMKREQVNVSKRTRSVPKPKH